MVIRIRLKDGPFIQQKRGKNRQLALAMAALLTPAAVMALVLGFWRFTSDLHWTAQFAIAKGPFSHWQVWVAAAITLEAAAIKLNRYGRSKESVQRAG